MKTLRKNRVVEVCLQKLAVKHLVAITGDRRMGEALKGSKPPGRRHILGGPGD